MYARSHYRYICTDTCTHTYVFMYARSHYIVGLFYSYSRSLLLIVGLFYTYVFMYARSHCVCARE
jgi:hypothetical protein